ncbi:MAG: hypothetical protein R6U42_10415, partial [Halomonas sp.]
PSIRGTGQKLSHGGYREVERLQRGPNFVTRDPSALPALAEKLDQAIGDGYQRQDQPATAYGGQNQ